MSFVYGLCLTNGKTVSVRTNLYAIYQAGVVKHEPIHTIEFGVGYADEVPIRSNRFEKEHLIPGSLSPAYVESHLYGYDFAFSGIDNLNALELIRPIECNDRNGNSNRHSTMADLKCVFMDFLENTSACQESCVEKSTQGILSDCQSIHKQSIS